MNRIRVTGGAGFLGSHRCDRLVSAGYGVLRVDDFFTGSKRNVADLPRRSDFELLRRDVTLPLCVEVDRIFKFACPASPVHYPHDPVQASKTAVHGAVDRPGLARCRRALFAQGALA